MIVITIILTVMAAGAAVWALMAQRALGAERVEKARMAERLDALSAEAAGAEASREERFRTLAAAVLAENAGRLEQSHRSRLDATISPLREELDKFRATVQDCYNTELREQHSLRQELNRLNELAVNVGHEAGMLGAALRGSNTAQGKWGEMMLESVLERSGMRPGVEFITQFVYTAPDGSTMKPDAIVVYPDGRRIAIDSKVSLTEYLAYCAASDRKTADDAGHRHAQAVRRQVEELRRRAYHTSLPQPEGLEGPNFTVMFMPGEPAYLAAMRYDTGLYDYALQSGVVVAAPSHLVALLRIVAAAWDSSRRNKHAIDIAEQASAMLDKFASFVEDMQTAAAAVDRARTVLDKAMAKLATGNGNLIRRATRLHEMGVKMSRAFPAINIEGSDGSLGETED